MHESFLFIEALADGKGHLWISGGNLFEEELTPTAFFCEKEEPAHLIPGVNLEVGSV